MPAFGEISGLQRPGHRHRRLCQTASRQRGEDHPHFHQPSKPGGGSPCASASTPQATPHVRPITTSHITPPPMRSARSLWQTRRTTRWLTAIRRPIQRTGCGQCGGSPMTTSSIRGYTPGEKGHSALLAACSQWLSMVGRWAKWTWR